MTYTFDPYKDMTQDELATRCRHLARLVGKRERVIKEAFILSRRRRWPLVQGVLEVAVNEISPTDDDLPGPLSRAALGK